jgi:5-methylcytosine-specific restriction endonuclease McrA
MPTVEFTIEVSDEDIQREKHKARELRQTQWWKNRRAVGVCYYCRRRFPARELTMDHIVPIVRGGKSTRANVVPCCKPCNDKKRFLMPSEWQEYMDALAARSVDS